MINFKSKIAFREIPATFSCIKIPFLLRLESKKNTWVHKKVYNIW